MGPGDPFRAAAQEEKEMADNLLRQAKLSSTPRYERSRMFQEAERHQRRAEQLLAKANAVETN